MNNDNSEKDLLDEELSDFFNDDEVKKDSQKEALDDLMGVFNVKQDFSKLKSIKQANYIMDKLDNIEANLQGLESVYGKDVTDKLEIVLANKEEIRKIIEEFLDKRDEMLAKMITIDNETRGIDDNEQIKRLFMYLVAKYPQLDTVFLAIAIDDMIERRNEKLSEQEGQSGGNNGANINTPEESKIDPNVVAVALASGEATYAMLSNEDVNDYLEKFFKKVALIENSTGIKLDPEFIEFFTSPQYILSSSYELPPLMTDDNFEQLKDTWSMPLLVNDSREEEMDKELYKSNENIKAMEKYYAENYGDTRDNSIIEALKGLSADVEEEKKRVGQDIEFFKKEKLKEKIEVAILASISGYTNSNPQMDTLSNLLKESITSRVEYMKDEEKLRNARKEIANDKTNKDNEKHSDDYFEGLEGVNKAIEKRREERALGYVSFVPQAIKDRKAQKEHEISNDEKSIDAQSISVGGRQKVLSYVNNYSNNNNIAA